MSEPVILYDIASSTKNSAFSPNTWKARYSLRFKGIPFKTVWIEFPDIKEVYIKLGVEPTSTKNGQPSYTLPVLQDPSKNKVIPDSMAIVRYLDETYPDTPRLMDAKVQILHHVFEGAVMNAISGIFPMVLPQLPAKLNPSGEEYFRRTREQLYGKKLEELCPPGPARVIQWKEVEAGFGKINDWFTKFGDPPFVMGEKMSFTDIFLGAILKFIQKAFGESSEEWHNIEKWHGGRWRMLLQQLDDLKVTDADEE